MSTSQIEEFKVRLRNGNFADVTGARKSIGRNGAMNDKTKELARAAADEHFSKIAGLSGSGGAAKKTTAKKTTAKVTAKKTAATAEAGLATRGKGGRKAINKSADTNEETVQDAVENSNNIVRNVQGNLTALQTARSLGADPVKVAEIADRAQQVLSCCIDKLLGHLKSTESQAAPVIASPVISSPVVPPPAENTNMTALGHAFAAANGQAPVQSGMIPPVFGSPQAPVG